MLRLELASMLHSGCAGVLRSRPGVPVSKGTTGLTQRKGQPGSASGKWMGVLLQVVCFCQLALHVQVALPVWGEVLQAQSRACKLPLA